MVITALTGIGSVVIVCPTKHLLVGHTRFLVMVSNAGGAARDAQ